MSENNLYRDRIIRYIYLQPEIDVSIKKINQKFSGLTKNQLDNKLEEMSQDNLINFGPRSNLFLNKISIVNDDGTTTNVDNSTPEPISDYSYVTLTLDGQETAEYHRKIFMKTAALLIAKPIISHLITFLLGAVVSFIIQLLFK